MDRKVARTGMGIITVGTGQRYREEIRTLIRSIQENAANYELTVFTDEPFLLDSVSNVREQVITNPQFTFFDKISAIKGRPYAHTLYVDVDTWITRDIKSLFELLRGCDVAATQDTWRVDYEGAPPETFPEPNCGVLLLGPSPAVDLLVEKWEKNYLRLEKSWTGAGGSYGDQHPLWEAIWEMQCNQELRFLSLPNEWNFHIWHPNSLAQNAMPGIIHGRGMKLDQVAAKLSRTSLARSWIPSAIGWNGKRSDEGIIFASRIGETAVRLSNLIARLIRLLKRTVLRPTQRN